jgi:hypothetical protein
MVVSSDWLRILQMEFDFLQAQELLSSPPNLDRLWDVSSLLSNDYVAWSGRSRSGFQGYDAVWRLKNLHWKWI